VPIIQSIVKKQAFTTVQEVFVWSSGHKEHRTKNGQQMEPKMACVLGLVFEGFGSILVASSGW